MPASSPELFSTVPKKDYLDFFQDDRPKYAEVVKFIEFKKEDVSKAADVPLSSVRYDEKMPSELRDRIREWANLINLVAQFFGGDTHKTTLWFTLPNPMLGNIAPRDMIRFGRYKKLLKFIINALSENQP